MVNNPFGIDFKKETSLDFGAGLSNSNSKKKRVKLTPSQRLYVWEHPNLYGRKCNICGQRINKQSELELDHTHPYSKGGSKMNLAHKDCNRMKGSKSLKHVQKKMCFKPSTRPKKAISKPKKVKRKATATDAYFNFKEPKIDFGLGKL